ncbi:MAG: helix-turn-helix transcriptional regulator [Rhodospirillaceae bacterium]|nr:helix-turn-helix transcriptional regulator [Rhodospirillaceae bacterium]MCA8932183.1 helix-turn-helix transcriptional regulator [Rhodospirillaceae bacterium]
MQEAIALDGLSEKAEDAVALLKALASPPRLLILCTLLEGERSVGELAAHLEMREATVSQNLTVLRREHIVATRRSAQTIYYSLAHETVREILASLARTFCPSGA